MTKITQENYATKPYTFEACPKYASKDCNLSSNHNLALVSEWSWSWSWLNDTNVDKSGPVSCVRVSPTHPP